MNCPHCTSASTNEQTQKTMLGYHMLRCLAYKRLFNERTGTLFNFLEYPLMLFSWLSCGGFGIS
ncbi:hypothetical protein KSX_00330 [Ktedonospora formicarum]|uniref:Uncharacterized protein n=1 Tax=Ktedonospora formicarum TaxID=2778364 RepID=A0A8J3MR23_9CHLR|nr:hypothetical protein KSX_00330 [Ktedonospora formicarum]